MTVLNESGHASNSSVWMYVVGTDLKTGQQGYVRHDGVFTPCSTADNGPDGFADLSIPLAGRGATRLVLPNMSGRVYFSLGSKLKFRVLPGAKLQYPAGWTSTDPSYHVLHDWVEFTHNDAGMFVNTTAVDMFALPLSITLTGSRLQTTGTLRPGGRQAIFTGVASQPGYEKLVVDDLRVLAPSHGLDAGLFATDYFESAIDEVWQKYTTRGLTVTTDRGSYVGRVVGDTLQFTGGVRPIARPSTRDVLFCDGTLAAPNDGLTGPVAAIVAAGLNRAVLGLDAAQPVADASRFYRSTAANHYAKVMHLNAVDGKAYGFAFDDVAGQASYVQDNAPTGFTVRLTSFGAAG
ncbi:MAG: hypothetical protein QOI76_3559 [Frankiales bacterium]|nr:hypothetical protein [Frankiales bacterium]